MVSWGLPSVTRKEALTEESTSAPVPTDESAPRPPPRPVPPAIVPALSVGAGRLVGDELLLNGRAFGHDHDDPNTPLPRRAYAELVGGSRRPAAG